LEKVSEPAKRQNRKKMPPTLIEGTTRERSYRPNKSTEVAKRKKYGERGHQPPKKRGKPERK